MGVILFVLVTLLVSLHSRYLHCQEIVESDIVSVYDKPLEFTGWQGPVSTGLDLDAVKIGLFAPESPAHPLGSSITDAANLAIEEANRNGGCAGIPFSLVSRWSYDPWGSGSKEMVKLVYQDKVWAVVGSLDGESSHIAEQVVTKTWLPLISPISSDPTLNYTRIPWMFRLPPDDKTQAKTIYKQGIQIHNLHRLGLITSGNHDGHIFSEAMMNILEKNYCPPLFHFQIPVHISQFESLARRILKFDPDGLILDLSPVEVFALLSELQKCRFQVHIFMPWIPGLQIFNCAIIYDGQIYTVDPFIENENPEYHEFKNRYYKKYNHKPSPVAAYTYDAVQLIINGLNKSGLNRSKLRDELSRLENFQGVTGEIVWDYSGGNTGKPVLKLISEH